MAKTRDTNEAHALLDLTQPVTISINTNSGNITVRTSDVAEVRVWADDDDSIEMLSNDSNVSVSHVQVGSRSRGSGRHTRIGGHAFDHESLVDALQMNVRRGSSDLRVTIPRELPTGSRLFLQSQSGDIRVEEITSNVAVVTSAGDVEFSTIIGDAELQSVSGDVRVRKIDGNLQARSTNGDIVVEAINGHANLNTVSGDIDMKAADLQSLQAKSSSGDIHIHGSLLHIADYEASSVSGDVMFDVDLPADGAVLSFNTISGDKDFDGPWILESKRNPAPQAEHPRVKLNSSSGDLQAVGRASDKAPSTAEPPSDDPTEPFSFSKDGDTWVFDMPDELLGWTGQTERIASITDKISQAVDQSLGSVFAGFGTKPAQETAEERRLKLLQAVERGEISVEEALRQFDRD